jgi:hypothetical protein
MVITWVIKTSLATLRAVVPCLACPGESEKNKGNKRNGVSFLCHTGRDGKRRKVEEESKLLYKNTEPDSRVRRRTMCCDASQDRSPLFLRPVKVALRGRRSRLRRDLIYSSSSPEAPSFSPLWTFLCRRRLETTEK